MKDLSYIEKTVLIHSTKPLDETRRLKAEMDDIGKKFDRDLAVAIKKIEKDFRPEGPTLREVIVSFLAKYFKK
jgi:hypothetical protein